MKKILSRLYITLVYIFLYAPIIVMIVFSFNSTKSRSVWTGFSLQWYEKLFNDSMITEALINTLLVAAIASIIATIIGTAAAIGINAFGKKSKQIIMNISNVPVMSPDIIIGISLRILFVSISALFGNAFELGFTTLVLAHITFNIPYVILSVMPKLRQLNKHTYEAAVDLGCNPFSAFFKVILPEIKTGITTGLMLAFTLSIDDFVVTYFVSSTPMLSTTIYSMTKRGVSPMINALSTIMFVTIIILLIIVNIRRDKDINKKKKEVEKN